MSTDQLLKLSSAYGMLKGVRTITSIVKPKQPHKLEESITEVMELIDEVIQQQLKEL